MQNNKKVCYVLGIYPNLSETFIQREINYFLAKEYEVFVYSLKIPSKNILKKCTIDQRIKIKYFQKTAVKTILYTFLNIFRFTKGFFNSLVKIFKNILMQTPHETFRLIILFIASSGLLSYVRKNNIKFVHAHFANASLMCLFAKQLNKKFQYSFTLHASADLYNRPLLLDEQFLFAKKIITISKYNVNFLHRYFSNIKKLSVIRNGVEIIPYEKKNTDKENLTLLSVGNYDYTKGYDILIKAIENIKNEYRNVKVIIVGDGPQFRSIENYIKSKNLQSVINLVGAKSHSETMKYFKQADIFVHSSVIDFGGRRDGFPTVILEAVSNSLPIITSYVSGIPELIENERTGIMVPEGNPEVLADAIADLISHQNKREALARNAHKKLVELFDISKTTKQLEKVIIG